MRGNTGRGPARSVGAMLVTILLVVTLLPGAALGAEGTDTSEEPADAALPAAEPRPHTGRTRADAGPSNADRQGRRFRSPTRSTRPTSPS